MISSFRLFTRCVVEVVSEYPASFFAVRTSPPASSNSTLKNFCCCSVNCLAIINLYLLRIRIPSLDIRDLKLPPVGLLLGLRIVGAFTGRGVGLLGLGAAGPVGLGGLGLGIGLLEVGGLGLGIGLLEVGGLLGLGVGFLGFGLLGLGVGFLGFGLLGLGVGFLGFGLLGLGVGLLGLGVGCLRVGLRLLPSIVYFLIPLIQNAAHQ